MVDEIKPKKPIWKEWWFWVIAVFVIIVITSADDSKKQEITSGIIEPIQEEPKSEITQSNQEGSQESKVKEEVEKELPQQLPIQEKLNYEIVVSHQDLLIGKNIYVKTPYSEQDLIEFLQYWKESTALYKRHKVIAIWLFSDRNEAKDYGKNIQTGNVNISKILGFYTSDPEFGNNISIQRNNKTVTIEEEKY